MPPDNIAVSTVPVLTKLAAKFRVSRCWRCRGRMKQTKGGSKCERCGVRAGGK
jgi:tRNA(Ile2) C34 agmatinyltransferase TiaS